MPANNPTVYSTEHGRMCPKCGRPEDSCTCKKGAPRPPGDGIVRVQRETKGHKGRTVTLITGVTLDDAGQQALLTDLKRMCGSGGTLKDGILEIQGDHRQTIFTELKKRGFPAKLAGG